MQSQFQRLYEQVLQKPETKHPSKSHLYSTAFQTFAQSKDINVHDDLMTKLLILYPDDVTLYSKMGNIYKTIHPQRAILWHRIGFQIDPHNEENTVELCRLLFENGMTHELFQLNNPHNVLDQFLNNPKFLGIYARANFQQLYYKNGVDHLLKLIQQRSTVPCLTKQDKVEKWKNYHDMGYVYSAMAQPDKALQYTNKAVELADKFDLDMWQKMLSFSNSLCYADFGYPDNAKNYQRYLRTNHYYPNQTPYAKRTNQRKQQKQNSQTKTTTTTTTKTILGFVSGDYKYHSIANFLVPILKNLTKSKYTIHLYANQDPTEMVDLYANLQPRIQIHYIKDQPATQVADLIQKHEIDVLFDLAGHTFMNRLDVFALNPTPIQITYMGYPNTTGLKGMQYRITDRIADHPTSTQQYSETLLRLPRSFLLYENMMGLLPTTPKTTDPRTIILGGINKENKNSAKTLETWSKILKQCPNTKLMIKLETFDNNEERTAYYSQQLDTTPDRLIIINKLQNKEYDELFARFDILLDTFPYSGTTTTCNALHNSVPLVTLYNPNYHSHNVSASILTHTGLPELVAQSQEEYVDIVKRLVENPGQIDHYKKTIQSKFAKAMEPATFIHDFEYLIDSLYDHEYFDKLLPQSLVDRRGGLQIELRVKPEQAKRPEQAERPQAQRPQAQQKPGAKPVTPIPARKTNGILEAFEINIGKNVSSSNENIRTNPIVDTHSKLEPEVTTKTESKPDPVAQLKTDTPIQIDLSPSPRPSLLFVSVFDYGSVDLGINHLNSLKRAKIQTYMAFVTDEKTYAKVQNAGHPVTQIESTDQLKSKNFFHKKKDFGNSDFTEMSFLRYKIISEQLKSHDAVWYMDVDTVVLRDLMPYYHTYKTQKPKPDMVYQSDIHQITRCTGCVLYFSSKKTIDATHKIYKGMNPNIPDQHYTHYFLEKNPGTFQTTFFDTAEFPNGLLYFDREDLIPLSADFEREKQKYEKIPNKNTAFVHANWMVGIDQKIRVLKKKGLWQT